MTEPRGKGLDYQIGVACRRPLDAVFLPKSYAADLAKLPDLAAEVARVRPLHWKSSPNEALYVTLKSAAAATGKDTSPPNFLPMGWAELAGVMIGRADPPNKRLDYNSRLKLIRDTFTRSVDTESERALRAQLWIHFATALRELDVAQAAPQQAAFEDRFKGEIARAELYSEARWSLRQAVRTVVLRGESGNGKTYLARQLVRDEYAGRRVLWLGEDVGNPSPYDLALTAYLEEKGMSQQANGGAAARDAALLRLLHDPESLDLLVLDNVSHGRARLLLEQSAVQALLTSRWEFTLPNTSSVPVGPYSEPEAIAAARTGFERATDSEIARFCGEVGYRPLVIDIACRLATNTQFRLDDIRETVHLNAAEAIDSFAELVPSYSNATGDRVSATMTEVYRRLADAVSSNVSSAVVLDVLLWLPRTSSVGLVCTIAEGLSPRINLTMAAGGIARLSLLGVIDISGDEIQMNDLTKSMLRALQFQRSSAAISAFFYKASEHIDMALIRGAINRGECPVTSLERKYLDAPARDAYWKFHGSNLQLSQMVYEMFAKDRSVGLMQVAPLEYIAFQRDFELFESGRVNEFAFIEAPAELPAVVTSSRGRRKLLRHRLKLVSAYILVHNVALRSSGIDEAAPPWGYGVRIWPTAPRNDCAHYLVSIFPSNVAASLGVNVWSRCGENFVPLATLKDAQQCDSCEAFEPDPTHSDYRLDILAMLKVLDVASAPWERSYEIFSAVTAIYLEIGELPPLGIDFLDISGADPHTRVMHACWYAISSLASIADKDYRSSGWQERAAPYLQMGVDALRGGRDLLTADETAIIATILGWRDLELGPANRAAELSAIAIQSFLSASDEVAREWLWQAELLAKTAASGPSPA
ncbi:hypothetical protein K8Z61_11540 [Nocardioides sp. TRM66260-LWL]|uniref:hypothetical protein n=1 Tax=Nocardioides sp. TRM66260-LWL TaxID=2874478 RepID=UPI001CC3C40F|nr:hypothetical protein [Nocardioides sp. TRM66260-LWL]MBZ5735130.1 hypothetical protein [Nocardioides sp. TRM66260-LWL]